jgi:putative oxygen-independent coproporphyrinogen III oxidase
MRLYVHWPFCASRCAYCDFNSRVAGGELHRAYHDALMEEAGRWAAWFGEETLDSIYVGGGTPSIMDGARLAELLNRLLEYFAIEPGAELTVEVNPSDWSSLDFMKVRAAGVNRFSIGVQSLDGRVLRLLGRRHDAREAENSMRCALASGAEVSADLLCALPSGFAPVADSLAAILALEPHHVSLYGLTLEDAVPMARWAEEGRITMPCEEEAADEYLSLVDLLRRRGYRQYEISNFSRPGCESRHNQGYWSREEYLGLGAGAHSFLAERRFSNTRSVLAYIRTIEGGGLPLDGWQILDENERRREEIMLGLRTAHGAPEALCIRDRLGEFESLGLLERRTGRIRLTPAGMIVSNLVITELMPDSKCA